MSTSAIFCHQSPKVVATDKSVTLCELADLLVVIDVDYGGRSSRRAALIQAKVAAPNGVIRPSLPGDVNQLRLYMGWPNFVFEKTGVYGTDSFDIRSGNSAPTIAAGARYGGLDDPVLSWADLAAAPSMTISGALPLGSHVTEMAFGRAGRSAVPGGSDDWSRLIDLLLSVANRETWGRANPIPRSRGSTTLSFSSDDGLKSGFSYQAGGFARSVFYERSPPNDGSDISPERPDGVLSSLHITIRASD